MKMRHCFAAIVLTFGFVGPSFAQYQPQTPIVPITHDGQEVVTYNSRYNFPLAVGTAPDEVEKLDNNYITKLREGLNHLAAEEAQKNAGVKVSIQRFTKESVTFFIAIAAVQLQSLIVEYSDNPSALQKHLESIADPIGQVSFYFFMLANGFTTNYLQKRTTHLDPANQRVAMKRIGYLGMAAGSIASSFSSELLTTLKECGKKVYGEKVLKDKQEEATKKENLEACDNALHQWTLNKKAQQYIPQIVSLLATAEIAQWTELGAKQVFKYGSGLQLAKFLASKSGVAFKFIAVQIGISALPGGLVIKTVAFIGKVTQFAAFTYIDHLIGPAIQKLFTNTFKPIEFHYDAKAFEASVAKSKEYNWQKQDSNMKVAKELDNMTELMKEWRQKQLSKFYEAHSVWGENSLRVIEQTQTTFGFYKEYIENLFKTLKTGHQIKIGNLKPTAMNNVTYYPFRLLPLYGVKISETLPENYSSAEDLYLEQPAELESYQIKTVRLANQRMQQVLAGTKFAEPDAKFLKELIQAFSGNNVRDMGVAIAKINAVLAGEHLELSDMLKNFMREIRTFLGNPKPILTPGMGFSYAYEINSFNIKGMETLKRVRGAGADKSRTSDYLWIQMVCGSTGKYYSNPFGFVPDFLPPKLIKKDLTNSLLCDPAGLSMRTATGVEMSNIYARSFVGSDQKTYQGINDLIYQNLRPEIIGDFTAETGQHRFSLWWAENVSQGMLSLFREFDTQYVHVLAKLSDNWNEPELSYLDRINQSKYLGKDVLENLSFELNIHANVLNDILNGRVPKDRSILKAGAAAGETKKVEFENLAAKPVLRTDFFKPTNQTSVSVLVGTSIPAVLEDPRGLLGRLRDAADADIATRTKVAEAIKARAAAQTAEKNRKQVASNPKVTAKDLAPYEKEIVRLNALATAAEKTAEQAVASLKPKINDTSLVRGEGYAKLKEIANLVEITQRRIDILRRIKVAKNVNSIYFIQNFPAKADSKEATVKTEEALKALSDVIEAVAPQTLGPTQMAVVQSAVKGLESVVSEVGSLTMAFYTTKYRLEDQYEDLIAELKKSRNETPAVKKTGFSPNGNSH